jgi:2-methylcitrate dehydratase PrpD
VTIITKDGRTIVERRTHPHGDAADPLSREEVIDKFEQASDGMLSPEASGRAIEMLNDLGSLERVSELCRQLEVRAVAHAGTGQA